MQEIYLDTETTGLNDDDEILEVCLIGSDDFVFLNTYICPEHKTSWPGAQKIHGISYDTVKNFPKLKSYIYLMEEIVKDNHLLIYNAGYDLTYLPFLTKKAAKITCIMEAFSKFYGTERWQKLTFAASYCGYDWGKTEPHRAISDCKAARHVWGHIKGKI